MTELAANIYFVGLMGAGKTTVARHLAKRLGRPFIDTDHELERRTGVRVPLIFEIEGESGFRDREERLLGELAQQQGLVVATGGGMVLRASNRRLLKETGTAIYLYADPVLLFERTRKDANRPLLQVHDPLARLQQLHAERDPLYRDVARLCIPTANGSVTHLVRKIEAGLAECVN